MPPCLRHQISSPRTLRDKPYPLMTTAEICALSVKEYCANNCWLFPWATPPKLNDAFEVIHAWGFHYRNIVYVWIKTSKDGVPISDKMGIRPTYTKTAWVEFVLCAGTTKTGRVTPINDDLHPSMICSRRRKHSEKPWEIGDLIVNQLGDLPRVELFARETRPCWDSWGNEI